MTTFAPRGQLPVPADRRALTAPAAPMRPGLLARLTGVRRRPESAAYDLVYRDDDGGRGDDDGWD